ncbi:MAG: 3-phosphoserine/phosphohydroxythreonine transaminase [Armatimonadota bacterium]
MTRVYNFNAGPAALPLPVLKKAQAEMLDACNTGMSIMEISHRSREFDAVIESAEANVRRLLGITDDYSVLFLQGGASMQFAMIPLNLRREGRAADYVNTGVWASKAINEAKIGGKVHVAWDGRDENYIRTPNEDELNFTHGAEYVHICSNETVGGIRFPMFPRTEAPLIADMSSEIMSRVIDVNRFGMIYAGAQKNLGPSGLALVIIRKDLIERSPETINIFLRYKTHAEGKSLYNTPNTWAIYILKLVTDWVEDLGGLPAMQSINEEKAGILYNTLDSSSFWTVPVSKESRSIMNIVWRLPSTELEDMFLPEAKTAGFVGLKGHRLVGGIRASIYNAVSKDAVIALAEFMSDFEKRRG